MYKYIVSVCFGCLFSLGLSAQDMGVDQVLEQISKNNRQIKAYQSFMASRNLANKSENNLQDPQASAYYLPFGEHETDDYYEYQISQRFEFPTVYGARSKRIEKQEALMELEYEGLRQEVLLNAKKQLLELQVLQKRKELEQKRVEQAREVYDQIRRLFEAEQIGILELNKAKVAWLQDQFEVEQLEIRMESVLRELQKMNGGQAIEVGQLHISEETQLLSQDAIWQEKLSVDPELKALQAQTELAEQQVKLEKNKVLPELSVGYNYQGVSSSNYSGFLGGLSIPLWNSKNKVKAAKARYEYEQSNSEFVQAELYTAFLEKFQRFQLLDEKYLEYKETFEDLNSEELLFKAYDLGELSFLDYYREVEFYRHAYNRMLEMEKELLQLKAELLKHQL
ncbi:Outer membrane protein TolC [Salinimicrobium catena]|uniref:Outer membrane protein TolC n=1 Tax=Salinimicrobium catena TaxID=390640 RepID=A0A1H5HPY1_9FLAO|nr:TolC family protein [Salinimicrobium catena]SDK71751.1 Outer membrane protein TolC [Salinimicrobium catena]SEE29854.1 Outer membrane protein TolC [Salinimicrobium catena]